MIFAKKPPLPRLTPPAGMGIDDVRSERSTCTGEMTVGFYDRRTRQLVGAQLVRSERDIAAFYAAYGWQVPPGGVREAGPGR